MKPPYRVPSMAEIRATPRHGLTIASTFSGIGGFDLGFEMDGWLPMWATDSDPKARDAFLANQPRVPFDLGDMQNETDDLVDRLLRVGVPDVLVGSPPCVVFSTAGPRKFGERRDHAGAKGVQIERLFFDFIRFVGAVRPRIVVAENVTGMLKGYRAQWHAREVVRRLRAHGYRVDDAVLDAQFLGVPQRRKRVIIVGVRADVRAVPFPAPLPYRYAVRDALPGVAHGEGWDFGPKMYPADEPVPTIMASTKQTIDADGDSIAFPDHLDLKRLGGFPDDFVLPARREEAKKRVGNSVCPPVARAIAIAIRDSILA
jgi:DNA (cytosine-5)-methyltransferase 1